MKNVVVFVVGPHKLGVELRWVMEVFTLGVVTRVPGAPTPILGALSHRGAIVALVDVVSVAELGESRADAHPTGRIGISLDVDTTRLCLFAERIDEVTTLEARAGGWSNGRGDPVTLLDPPMLLRKTKRLVDEAAARQLAFGSAPEA